MSFTQVEVTGTLLNAQDAPMSRVFISFNLSAPITDGSTLIGTQPVTVQTESDGTFSVDLIANDDVTTTPSGTYYTVQIGGVLAQAKQVFNITVLAADAPTVDLFALTTLSSTPSPITPAVNQLQAGSGITLSPGSGQGLVTISASGMSPVTNAGDISASLATTSFVKASQIVTPPVYVDQNILRDATGKRIVMRGVCLYAMPWYEGSGGPNGKQDASLLAAATNTFNNIDAICAYLASQKMNIIRIPQSYQPYEDQAYMTKAAWLVQLQTIVATAAKYGIMTLISIFNATGYGSALNADFIANDEPLITDLYGAVGSSPWVMWAPFNEPTGLNAITWITPAETAIQFFRSTLNYQGVLWLDTPNFAAWFNTIISGIDAIFTYATANPASKGPNILFAHHIYPTSSSWIESGAVDLWETEIGNAFGYFPIAIEEHGFASSSTGYTVFPDCSREILDYLIQGNTVKGYPSPIDRGLNGVVGFVFDWIDPNTQSMGGGIHSDTQTQLTPSSWGQIFRDRYLLPAAVKESIPIDPQAIVTSPLQFALQATINLGGATGGTWTPQLEGVSGSVLQWNATATQVQAALRTIVGESNLSFPANISAPTVTSSSSPAKQIAVSGASGVFTVTFPPGTIPGSNNGTNGLNNHLAVVSSLVGGSGVTITQPGPGLVWGRVSGGGGTAITPLPASGTKPGDTLLFFAGASGNPNSTVPGWTHVSGSPANADQTFVMTRTATGSITSNATTTNGSPTLTTGGPQPVSGMAVQVALGVPANTLTTGSATAIDGSYESTLAAMTPTDYWQLGETTGTSAADTTGADTGTYVNGVTLNQTGLRTANAAPSVSLAAATNGYIWTATQITSPAVFSEVITIKTVSQAGGRIMGFGVNQSGGTSGQFDRTVYMLPSGQICFYVFGSTGTVITSPNSYNDGKVHHVGVTFDSSHNMILYVDGVSVATGNAGGASSYLGYWRLGYDSLPVVQAWALAYNAQDWAVWSSTALTATQMATLSASAQRWQIAMTNNAGVGAGSGSLTLSDPTPVLTFAGAAAVTGAVVAVRGGRLGTPSIDQTSFPLANTTVGNGAAEPRLTVANNGSIKLTVVSNFTSSSGVYTMPPGEAALVQINHTGSNAFGMAVGVEQVNIGQTLNKPAPTANTGAVGGVVLLS